MASRIAVPTWMRAEGARLDWTDVLRFQMARTARHGNAGKLIEARLAAVKGRPAEVQLRWSCAPALGVPFEPFQVWVRFGKDSTEGVRPDVIEADGGLRLRWGFVAAVVEVDCDVIDPSRAVGLFVSRGGTSLRETVGATAVSQPNGGRVTLRVRTSGATRALLVNGRNPSVRCQRLQDVLDDGNWDLFELVGLPADDPWPDTAYRAGEQGLRTALTDPVSAAFQRLERGGPPIGWAAVTETGRVAPEWRAPDYKVLIDEVRNDLLPNVARLFRAGLVPPQQAGLIDEPAVDRPQHAGKQSSLAASVKLAPLSLLALPAASDPFLALATGFGTAYATGERSDGSRLPPGVDFLVTAEYQEVPVAGLGPVTMAAYVPAPAPHGATAAPTGLTAERSGLIAPDVVDKEWRETVRLSWNRVQSSAALGRPSGAAAARFDTTGGDPAECLLEQRAAGDFRPLLPVPDGPPATPGFARTAMVDAAATIPLGGTRFPGYPVAVQDVFGVWSLWDDVLYTGSEPALPAPRLISVALTSTYGGSTSCPAQLEVEFAVDWAVRTPSFFELNCVLFPMATAIATPPAGVGPELPAPPGCFRLDSSIAFLGDELDTPTGGAVEHLDTAGEEIVPPGPDQGEEGRRYRLRVPVPTLDFAATRRWGAELWARSRFVVVAAPSGWSPGPAHPARTSAASPVPVLPLPPPLPPGVPVGSTPDAQGRSHARVRWALPTGADVDKVVVWEVAETALRQAAGLQPRADEGISPGVRLQALWNVYDAMPADRRRAAFRRLQVLAGTARDTDVALPRGSTDIHLFTVTTVTSTAVDSPWPGGSPPHLALQAVMAPRLRTPSAPRVVSVVGAAGAVTLSLTSNSRVAVKEFRLYRTRSEVAARSADTMGPAFAVVVATLAPPVAGAPPDPGLARFEKVYQGPWSGTFPTSWDDWFVRAVAVPVDGEPVEAVRGLPSPACEPVTLSVLPGTGPDLAPLVAELWGPGDSGVVVRTSTSAPVRPVGLGSHRVSAAAGAAPVAAVALEDTAETAAPPPPGASPGPVLVRGARVAGRSSLALWFTRAVPTDPVEVTIRLADPLGRVTAHTLVVPGMVPPPPVTLDLLDVFKIVGRGTVLRLRSDAPLDAEPPYVLRVVAVSRVRTFPLPNPRLRPVPVTASFPLDEIPRTSAPFPSNQPIQAVRATDVAPHEYNVLVRLTPPFDVTVTLRSPDGASVDVRTEVR